MRTCVAALVLLAGSASSAFGQIGGCCHDAPIYRSTSDLQVEWTVDFKNNTVSSSSGTAVAGASCVKFVLQTPPYSRFCDECLGVPCPDVKSNVDGETSNDLQANPVTATASVAPNCSDASAHADLTSGMTTSDGLLEHMDGTLYDPNFDFQYCGPGYLSISWFGSAFSSAVFAWNLTPNPVNPMPITFLVEVHVDIDITITPSQGCPDCPEGGGGGGPIVIQDPPIAVRTVTYALTATYDDDSTETEVLQAVFAEDADGNITRLGAFTDPAFDPVDLGGGNMDIDGMITFEPQFDAIGIESIDGASIQDEFDEFDGDIDADTAVCWTDRELFAAILGSTIGDGNYNARADFDLDGSITTSDLALFNDQACTVDVNCDGTYNIIDFTQFQAAYTAQDPAADMNGDGNFNALDFVEFQLATQVGCS